MKNFSDTELATGLNAVPLGRVLLRPGERVTLQARSQIPLRGPYRLALSPCLAEDVVVHELRIGNVSIFAAPGVVEGAAFGVPTDWADGLGSVPLSKRDARGLIPIAGPDYTPGVWIRLDVENRYSAANVELVASLWAAPIIPDSRVLRSLQDLNERIIARPSLRRDQLATRAHLERVNTPLDAANDAAWESPTDEWP